VVLEWEDVIDRDVETLPKLQSIVKIGVVKNVGKNKQSLQGKNMTPQKAIKRNRNAMD
jgi:hypothetical protein